MFGDIEILFYGKLLRNIQAPTKRRILWYELQHGSVIQIHKSQESAKSATGGRVYEGHYRALGAASKINRAWWAPLTGRRFKDIPEQGRTQGFTGRPGNHHSTQEILPGTSGSEVVSLPFSFAKKFCQTISHFSSLGLFSASNFHLLRIISFLLSIHRISSTSAFET